GPSPANHGSTSFNSPVTANLPQPPRASRIAASGSSKVVVGVAATPLSVVADPAGGFVGEVASIVGRDAVVVGPLGSLSSGLAAHTARPAGPTRTPAAPTCEGRIKERGRGSPWPGRSPPPARW